VVHLSFGNQEAWTAWNASTSAEAVLSGQAKLPEDGDLGLGWVSKGFWYGASTPTWLGYAQCLSWVLPL
jgi:hypothetical protein